jgi:hypothetical protein
MRYAGLMSPPSLLTQSITEYVVSQSASNYVEAISRKIKEYEGYRGREERRFEPLFRSVDRLKLAVKSRNRKDVHQAHRDLVQVSSSTLGLGFIKDLKKASPSSQVKRDIEKVSEEIERQLSLRERKIPSLEKVRKGFQSLRVLRLDPMDSGEERVREFAIDLESEDWYVDQKSLEEHRESVVEFNAARLISEMRYFEKTLDRLKTGHRIVNRYTPEELAEEIEYFTESIQESKEKIQEIRATLRERPAFLSHINVTLKTDFGTSYWMPSKNNLVIFLGDIEWVMESATSLPDPRSHANGLQRMVVHEMTHASQTILAYITSKIKYFSKEISEAVSGLPSKKVRTPEYKQEEWGNHDGLSRIDVHYLDDVEFYTDLRDSVRSILRQMKNQGLQTTQERNLAFKYLVGSSVSSKEDATMSRDYTPEPFFLTLKRHARAKYNKAVGEAYKLIFNTQIRMARRIARSFLNY